MVLLSNYSRNYAIRDENNTLLSHTLPTKVPISSSNSEISRYTYSAASDSEKNASR